MNNEQNESSIDEPPAAKRLRQMYTRSLNEVMMVNDDEDDVQILTNNNNNNNSKKHLHEKISQIIVQSVTATIDLGTLAEKYENDCKVAEVRLKGVEERNVALEKDLASVKRALEAKELELEAVNAKLEAETRAHGKALEKVRIAEAKLVVSGQQAAFERMRVLELERQVAIERAHAEEGKRLKAGSLARYEKKMKELSAVLATRLEEFNNTAKIRLMESELRTVANCWVYDEYQKKLLALAVRFYKEGFTTCLEQLQNLGHHFPEGLDISFLTVYADGMDRLDGEDGASAASP